MLYRILFTASLMIVGLQTSADASNNHHHHAAAGQTHNGAVHTHRSHHSASQSRRGLPIVHYGYGYVYDPYARGTFEMQDPLKDPLFQARHKFDSRFPGRYTPNQKRRYQQNVWNFFQR
jgi:hypothetical protein